MERAAVGAELTRLEQVLDPARPRAAGVDVLAYGEISATLRVPGDGLDGLVAKRMSGFPDASSAFAYAALVRRYCSTLSAGGLSVIDTEPMVVERQRRGPVVYLMQPLVPAEQLGNSRLRSAPDDQLRAMVALALQQTDLARAAGGPGVELAIDGQLSNFAFNDGTATLIDVGTPFIREHGRHLLDVRVMLAAVPPGIREVYIRRRIGEQYMDDYFDRRLVAVDMLGNFIKEGAAHRIGVGAAAANQWLGAADPITEQEVRAYYDKDAATLELFLRVRRWDRWIRTHLLRQPYDFILPGRVQR